MEPPYTRVALLRRNVDGSTVKEPLPSSLEPHVTVEEWDQFWRHMEPLQQAVGQRAHRVEQMWTILLLLCALSPFVLALTLPNANKFIVYPLITVSLFFVGACLILAWSARMRRSYLNDARTVCRLEEERYFRERGFVIEFEHLFLGYYIYFLPVENRLPERYQWTYNDEVGDGSRNGYLCIQLFVLHTSIRACQREAVPMAHLESYGTLPFMSESDATLDVWDGFWTCMLLQSRELLVIYRWYRVLKQALLVVMLFTLGAIAGTARVDVSDVPLTWAVSICIPWVILIPLLNRCRERLDKAVCQQGALVRDHANEFADQGWWIEHRHVVVYQYGMSRAYYLYLFPLLQHPEGTSSGSVEIAQNVFNVK